MINMDKHADEIILDIIYGLKADKLLKCNIMLHLLLAVRKVCIIMLRPELIKV